MLYPMVRHVMLGAENLSLALQQQFYAPVQFKMAGNAVEEAVLAFFDFLKEPVKPLKNISIFRLPPQHRRGDVGYKHRDANDHVYNDSKEFFHFHPALFEHYPDFLKANPVVNNFAEKAKPIWDLVYLTVKEILQRFEGDFPGVVEKVFDTKYPHILLRFLKYEWDESGEYLAKPHFDAGSCTLAIAESCPGLRIGSCPENLKLVEHKSGNAIFMFSSNFQKIIDATHFSPGWHDVIQLDKAQIGKSYARWAVVAFIDAHSVEALPREETHKWFKTA